MKNKAFSLNNEKKKKKKNKHTHNWHNTDFILEVKFHKENFLAKYH